MSVGPVGPRAREAVGGPAPGRRARVHKCWEQEHVFGYGLILPALALLVSLVAFPFGMAIYFSLSDYWVGSPGGFVGLANYRAILCEKRGSPGGRRQIMAFMSLTRRIPFTRIDEALDLTL